MQFYFNLIKIRLTVLNTEFLFTVRKKQAKDVHAEEPEWFTFGPSSQFETMELKGFDDVEDPKKGAMLC